MENTSSCALVPIFSNKKRRVKQALYSNPSTNNTCKTNSFQSSSSSSQMNNAVFPAEEVGHVVSKNRWIDNRSSSFRKNSSLGNAEFHAPPNPPIKKQTNVMASSQPRNTRPDAQKATEKRSAHIKLLPKPVPISKGNFSKQSLKIDQQIKEDSHHVDEPKKLHNADKQKHVVKDHQKGNSPKVLTTFIKNLMDWEEFRGKMTFIFEVFGTLESAVSTGISNNSKTFILKDDTGSIRCTFWEMDRVLPRLIRGKSYRCIGSMDRMNRSFNCVTVRPSTLAELHSAKISIACTQLVMQAYVATFRED